MVLGGPEYDFSPYTERGKGKGSEEPLTDDLLSMLQPKNRRTENSDLLAEAQILMAVEGRSVNDVAFRHRNNCHI